MNKLKPRYLTKSRFKLALECPTKLYYTRKLEYENQIEENPFLEALAEGGFQVEELARMYYPDGVAITGDDWNYDLLMEKTASLLKQENVTIFEAAFFYNGLFIRVDILDKKGNDVKLIEVKAKSISGNSHESFIVRNNKLNAAWTSYLYDVAFQQYVIENSFPNWNVSAFLNLVDKDITATVKGINQFFKISKKTNLRTGIIKKEGLSLNDLGVPLLAIIDINSEIKLIHETNPLSNDMSFEAFVQYFQEHYQNDIKIETPIGQHCKGCEFKNPNLEGVKKSGFHECWNAQLDLSFDSINASKTFDIWNFRGSKKLIEAGKLFMSDLEQSDIGVKPLPQKLSSSERQWLQVEKNQNKDNTPHIEIEGLRDELIGWVFPLNFIDFETSTVALPFTKGRRPYEQTAFQFSHHIVLEDKSIIHANEYLNNTVGEFPNFDFLRALKTALEANVGSIFRYHNHENTVLNQIYVQLLNSEERDKQELLEFIKHISHSTSKSPDTWRGERDMIDLFEVVKNYYFDPSTQGSISIKAILPSVLNNSDYLRKKYAKPISKLNLTSKNFREAHSFIPKNSIPIESPYKSLPPLFEDWSDEALENLVSEMGLIADGGAALTAYSKLQFEDMTDSERQAISVGLLKYCELDTLAMVMIYEYFRELIK